MPAGPIFIAMNYTVHTLMYGYYFFVSIRSSINSGHKKQLWFFPLIVTVAQICQMFMGCLLTFFSIYLFITDNNCKIQPVAMVAGGLMYGSYLFLFIQYFLSRYPIITNFHKDNKVKIF